VPFFRGVVGGLGDLRGFATGLGPLDGAGGTCGGAGLEPSVIAGRVYNESTAGGGRISGVRGRSITAAKAVGRVIHRRPRFSPLKPEDIPACIQQIVRSDRCGSTPDGDPIRGTLLCLLVVSHWSVPVERRKTELRVDLENPLLAFRRVHSIVI